MLYEVITLNTLWSRTKEVLPYKEVDDNWINEKFGIKVTGTKQSQQNSGNNLQYAPDFFV